ncbi:hypothetical protein QV06_06760 [Gallibacterium genomosp. 3]|uniref:Uncharacterized protein n=1 Tax=Gallibacterium genomosp. 3 TaxID=505345 RepID=A0A1A7PQM3_9PAST|nr:hypothetical protein [Gallibacterium genomosp. 3]OBX04349.1 hypothetical protein QV06_06760 [Gallibacterium genomosp. 3]
MPLSKMNKENRRLSNKFLLLTVLLGGVWSVIFNLIFVNREISKDILIEIYRYSLIAIDTFFLFLYFFIVWKKFGFFTYFVKRVNYNSKIKFFLFLLFGFLLLSIIFFGLALYNLDEIFYNVENSEEITRREVMNKAIFSFSLFGVWYLSSMTLFFTYLLSDAAIIFCLIVRYFFDKKYRERYKHELNKLEQEIGDVNQREL